MAETHGNGTCAIDRNKPSLDLDIDLIRNGIGSLAPIVVSQQAARKRTELGNVNRDLAMSTEPQVQPRSKLRTSFVLLALNVRAPFSRK